MQTLSRDIKRHFTSMDYSLVINPVALRKAKIVCNFGLFECNRVKLLSAPKIITAGVNMTTNAQLGKLSSK